MLIIRITFTRKNLPRCLCVSVTVSAASATTGVLKRVKRRWFRRIIRRIKKVFRKIKKVVKKVVRKIRRFICNRRCSYIVSRIGRFFRRVYVCKRLCGWVVRWSSRQRTTAPSSTRWHDLYLSAFVAEPRYCSDKSIYHFICNQNTSNIVRPIFAVRVWIFSYGTVIIFRTIYVDVSFVTDVALNIFDMVWLSFGSCIQRLPLFAYGCNWRK